MGAPEVAWRVRSLVRRKPLRPENHPRSSGPPEWWRERLLELIEADPPDLIRDAERIAGGELCFWGRLLQMSPTAPEWTGETSDGGDSAWRDWRRDLKPGWELHRQQHLVPLAAGGVAGDRPAWRRLAGEQMLDWIDHNPFGLRPAWSSGYETAHRLVGWAWILPLIWPDLSEEEQGRIWDSYALQVEYVLANPSLHSSANNHRLMELVGLFAAAAIGASVSGEDIWLELERQVERQTYPDGGSREQASGYFLYVLEMLWVAALMRVAAARPLGRLEERLRAMLTWLATTRDSGGEPPPFGDDAEDRPIRLRYFMPRRAADIEARVRSLLNGEGVGTACEHAALLRDSGLLVIRSHDGDPETTITMDVGELGFGTLAAHGHADALSLVGITGDHVLLRDSGTGSYAPALGRDAFRLTSAHNTVVVNGESQAVPAGPHLWGHRYRVAVEAFDQTNERVYLRAAHDGYMRLPERARHTRSVLYLAGAGMLVVLDRVEAEGAVAATLVWQLSPDAYPERLSDPGGSLGVAATPEPSSARRDGPFSQRYGEIGTAPRYLWSATGEEVVFASAISLPQSPFAADVDRVDLRDGAVRVDLDLGGRRMRIDEDWSSPTPEVG